MLYCRITYSIAARYLRSNTGATRCSIKMLLELSYTVVASQADCSLKAYWVQWVPCLSSSPGIGGAGLDGNDLTPSAVWPRWSLQLSAYPVPVHQSTSPPVHNQSTVNPQSIYGPVSPQNPSQRASVPSSPTHPVQSPRPSFFYRFSPKAFQAAPRKASRKATSATRRAPHHSSSTSPTSFTGPFALPSIA